MNETERDGLPSDSASEEKTCDAESAIFAQDASAGETVGAEADKDGIGEADENPTPTDNRLTGWLDFLQTYAFGLAIVLLVFACIFRVCTVSGISMQPTLQNGEKLLISSFSYEPKTGDIVVFHQTSTQYEYYNEPIIKRVIAVAGQTVCIDFTAGTVSVDGAVLDEPYIQLLGGSYSVFGEHDTYYQDAPDGTVHRLLRATVPEGKIFVMGDNRNRSADSRTDAIGFVDARRILGHVLFRFSPLSVAGTVQ